MQLIIYAFDPVKNGVLFVQNALATILEILAKSLIISEPCLINNYLKHFLLMKKKLIASIWYYTSVFAVIAGVLIFYKCFIEG